MFEALGTAIILSQLITALQLTFFTCNSYGVYLVHVTPIFVVLVSLFQPNYATAIVLHLRHAELWFTHPTSECPVCKISTYLSLLTTIYHLLSVSNMSLTVILLVTRKFWTGRGGL